MTRIHIPNGATMKYRKQGRWVFSVKRNPIVWTSRQPDKGTQLYVVGWNNGQQSLLASRVETQE